MNDLPSPAWTGVAPAPADAVARVRAALPGLQEGYLSYLCRSNGGEGDLGVEPGWCQLWPTESLIQLNQEYRIAELLPGYVAVGSDGGGELIVQTPDGRVATVPAIGMAPEEALEVAATWEGFEASFGHSLDAA